MFNIDIILYLVKKKRGRDGINFISLRGSIPSHPTIFIYKIYLHIKPKLTFNIVS